MTIPPMSTRAHGIFRADLRQIVHRTDRMFFWLLIGQWLFAIAIALIWSPRTWIGQDWSVHQHVLAAALAGALVAAYPVYCILRRPGTRDTRHVIAIGQMLQSALLVHVTGGRIETHFHVFGSLALLAFYRDWRVLLTASAVVVLDHLALGIWFPLSVYGEVEASFWRSAEHAFWVVFEVIFLAMACRTGMRELAAMAERQAEIETVAADLRESNAAIQAMSVKLRQANELLETRVEERTQTLTKEINDRRQAQEALAQQSRVLQSILNNMGEAVIVADPGGTFLLVNPTAEHFLATPERDIPWQQWPARYGAFYPDQVTPFVADRLPLVRAIRGESCDEVEVFLRNARLPQGVYLSCNARPIRNEQGELQGGVVVFHDITGRKLAEEALEERARLSALTADVAVTLTKGDRLPATLQHCAQAVVRHLDAALARIWTLNEANQMLELQASAGLYTHLDGPDMRVPVGQDTIGLIAKEGKPHFTNDVIGDPGIGEPEWARREGLNGFAGYPLTVKDQLVGVLALFSRRRLAPTTFDALGVVADGMALGIERFQAEQGLTRAREAKVMAEAANRAKNEFLSRMSHELRTPLNAILGFGQLLEMNDLSDDQRECVGQITRGGKHLLCLINEVLDIARIEAGRMDLSPEPVRVADAFQEALELVQPLGARRDIQFHADLEGANGHCVLADNQKLKQVLLNLLSNAVKYNRHRGQVRLSCEAAAPGRLRLAVSDTGLGIPADKLGRLFVPFDRLGAEQTGVEGSGLGLAFSKSLVELMGGTLSVTSAVGEGSRFCLELAQAEDPKERGTAGSDEMLAPAAGSSATRTVLYIEDNVDNLRLVQRIVAHRPAVQLLTASQGSLGTDLARQHRPDLILLDVHLPDLNGEQVLRRLGADPETRAIPVVVVSADATARQMDRLRAAGAWDYLTKPIDVKQLLRILDQVLEKGTLER